MGIMDFFTGAANQNQPQAPQQQSTPSTPGAIPNTAPATGQVAPGTAPNGMVPPGTDMAGATKQESPLDPFADLWKNDPVDPNAAKPAGVFGEVDPQKFIAAASKVDFAKAVTQEQLQAIQGGGDAAVKALAGALNSVSQQVYAQSAFASTKIVEQALARAKESFLADLPQHIKKQTVSDSLRAENPIFANPAVQPIINALEAQLTVKFPQASAGEITAMAKQYVEALGTSFTPKPKETSQTGAKQETDWSQFLM